MTLRILDACCGVGGATRGYKLAIPDCHVTGVDIEPQPEYVGDAFVQGDAVEYVREHGHEYDFIHASWPCQYSCALTKGTNKGRVYPNLIPAGRAAQRSTGRPWVIENVAGAEIRKDLRLCGDMFRRPDGSYELAVMRHRFFEFSAGLSVPQPRHPAPVRRVAGLRHGEWFTGPYFAVYGRGGGKGSVAQWRGAMGIDWTWERRSIAEAIPPAYTRWIAGRVLVGVVGVQQSLFEVAA